MWTACDPRHDLRMDLQSCLVTRAAAFFDLDKTVIAKSSTLAFGRPFFHGGLINRRAVLKAAYAQFVFSLAGAVESGHRVATVCHLANLSLRLGRKLRWDAGREEIIGDTEASRELVRPYRAPWDRELQALGVGGMP